MTKNNSGGSEPTPRQLEALQAIYFGHSINDRRFRKDFGRSYARSVGGAVARMQERMGEAGWLVQHETTRGRTYFTNKLTAAGLTALAARMPELEGINERLIEQRAAEVAAAEEAAKVATAEAEQEAREREADAIARRAGRIAAMREIAQAYQVRLDLSDDQCLAMWIDIVKRERQL